MSGRSRVPIYHDDVSFHDRNEGAFRDMQRRMDDDFGGRGFGGFGRSPWNWEDDLDRMCGDFHKLKPRNTRLGELSKDEYGSRESLDDNASKNMYVEHPQTKSRTFHMSFDVKDYNPGDISVKAEGENLVIIARHEDDVGGHVNVREFSRKIKIPQDVDVDKLSSTLSNDGILTIQAPVPPKYTSVAYVSPSKSASTNGTGSSLQYKAPPAHDARSSTAPPQYPPPPPAAVLNQPPQLNKMSSAPAHTPSPPPQAAKSQSPLSQPARTQPPPSQVLQKQREIQPPQVQAPAPLFQQPDSLQQPLDTPIFKDSPDGIGRTFELALEVQRPFTPEDVVVKLEGKSLRVEATHVVTAQGKSSSSSMSRNFDLAEDLDPGSVEAMLRSDGCLLIKGKVL